MSVPTSKANRPAIRRSGPRTYSRSAALRRSRKTAPDQIGNRRRIGDRWNAVPCRLNIECRYRRVSCDFVLKIADRDVERGPGDEIGGCVVKARLGKLPVRGGAGEIRESQGSSKHDKGENNDQRSAFRCAITRMEELFHGVKTFMG